MTGICKQSDSLHFFRSWIAAPLRVASVTPSSRSLARLMTQEITAGNGPVIELGPGTGVFTRALLERGVDEADLTLIEYGSEFTGMLKLRFPQARVLQQDATTLDQAALYPDAPVGAVISGLPLLSMTQDKIAAILSPATNRRSGRQTYIFE